MRSFSLLYDSPEVLKTFKVHYMPFTSDERTSVSGAVFPFSLRKTREGHMYWQQVVKSIFSADRINVHGIRSDSFLIIRELFLP